MHSFDPKIAERVGVNAAVLYQNIVWWCAKNAANKHNEHDGRFWTYNSVKAWAELFPYLSAAQIRLALQKLEDNGLILSGVFNEIGYDRTKWYCPSEQIHLSENANGVARKNEPIPVSKPDIKPVDKHSCVIDGFEEFWERYPRKTVKSAARKAYAKAVKKAQHDDIMFGLSQQMLSLTAREAQYIPHPATWLNQERWNDEPEQPSNNSKHPSADAADRQIAFAAAARRTPSQDCF